MESLVPGLFFTGICECNMGFPHSSVSKESTCNTGDLGSVPGLGRPPGEGKGYPLQCSCLENSVDRGAWWATVRGVAESDTAELLSTAQHSLSVTYIAVWLSSPPCLLLSAPYSTGNHSTSVRLLLFCYIHLFIFLDSTCTDERTQCLLLSF